MPNEYKVTAAFVQDFHDAFEHELTQKESRLLATVHNRGSITGKSFTINDLGSVEMKSYSGRFTDTVWTHPDAGTRTVIMGDYSLFLPIEHSDLPKMKAHPSDSYMRMLVESANRKKDDVIYQALVGSVSRKTVSDAGVETSTNVALPAGQIILANTTPLTKAKLIKGRSIFRKNEADSEDINITYSSQMMEQILADTTLTSADFMAVKMLQEGDISGKWLGMNWIPYEKQNAGAGGATELRAAMYSKTAVHFGDAPISQFKINERPDKNNINQVGGVHSYGAGRANEKKVVLVDYVI